MKNTMSDKLQQMNVQYSNKEDRVLLRVSTESCDEHLIWLTRRYTKMLLTTLDKEIKKHGGTMILNKKKEISKLFDEGVFEKPYMGDKIKNHPLGSSGILAFGLKTGHDQNTNLLLEIQSEKASSVTFNLNSTLTYMFYSLLTQATTQADWQIGDVQHISSSQLH